MPEEIIRLTRAQVREVDRRAIEDYHIPGIVLMENAAFHAAEIAWEMLGRDPKKNVMIFCGGGNNGGDGLAIARHLHNRGIFVELTYAFSESKSKTAEFEINDQIVQKMGMENHAIEDSDISLWGEPDLVIDALLGTGLTSPPRGQAKLGIEIINEHCKAPILAIDLPSGLDCDTGLPLSEVCIKATRTVTFVAEKAGFANPASKQYTGEVTVADIGCPTEIITQVLRDIPA